MIKHNARWIMKKAWYNYNRYYETFSEALKASWRSEKARIHNLESAQVLCQYNSAASALEMGELHTAYEWMLRGYRVRPDARPAIILNWMRPDKDKIYIAKYFAQQQTTLVAVIDFT